MGPVCGINMEVPLLADRVVVYGPDQRVAALECCREDVDS